MKTMFTMMAVALTFAAIASTPDTTEATITKKKSGSELVLTKEQDKLFATGRLNETVIPPLYTTVEQLIFTEQIKRNVSKN
jgi:hypothetical protein